LTARLIPTAHAGCAVELLEIDETVVVDVLAGREEMSEANAPQWFSDAARIALERDAGPSAAP